MSTDNDKAYFVGDYVQEMAKMLRASALTGIHAFTVGEEPGTGKTEISLAAGKAMFGDDRILFLRINPATEPLAVVERYDPQALITSGQIKYIKDGTPLDPQNLATVYDELSRGNEALLNAVLEPLDLKTYNHEIAPVAFATGNWLPYTRQTQAMLDRFGYFYKVPDEDIDISEFVQAHAKSMNGELYIDFELPTLDEIKDVRNMRFGEHAVNAVAQTIAEFTEEVAQGLRNETGEMVRSFRKPNRRRLRMWEYTLLRVGYYVSGDNDFSEVPQEAFDCLKWCWRGESFEELDDWGAMISVGTIDPVNAAVERMVKAAFTMMVETQEDAGLSDYEKAVRLGEHITESVHEIKELMNEVGRDDDLSERAQRDLQVAMARVSQGKDPFEG